MMKNFGILLAIIVKSKQPSKLFQRNLFFSLNCSFLSCSKQGGEEQMARLLFTSSLRAFPLFSQPYPVSSFSSPLLSLASTSRLVPLSSPRLLSTDQTKPQREPFLASRYLADSVLEAIVEHPSLTSSTDPEEAVLAQKNRILGTEESPNIEALVRWPREQKGSLNHHFTCHAAHKYSRILGCGAEDLSDHVTKVLNQRASELGLSSVDTGKGFLTFTLSDDILREVVYSFALSSTSSPVPSIPPNDTMNNCTSKSMKWANKLKRGTVAIDYASPNAAKELHAGHMRSLVIGESLSRLLRATGNEVNGYSHVGDFGTPIGLVLGECFLSSTSPKDVNARDLSHLYVAAKQKAGENPEFYDFAKTICMNYQRMLLLEGEGGEAPSLEYEGRVWEGQEIMDGWNTILEKSREHFEEIFDLFSVEAVEKGESSYVHLIPKVMKEMEQKGILKEVDGAKVVWFDEWETPLIVQKKDGGYLYSTTDLAAGYYRLVMKNYDRCIYVTDAGQSLHFKKVFQILNTLGWVREGATLEHAHFGVVRFSGGGKLSSRSGGAETLQGLLNSSFEAAERAIPVAQSLLRCERVPASEEQRTLVDEPDRGIQSEADSFTADRIEKLGVAALRYFELTHRKSSDYELNLARMLSFNSNSIVYVMYAFTRIQSIISRYEEHHQLDDLDYENIMKNRVTLGSTEEKKLAFWISQFDDQVYAASMLLLPNTITEYIYNLAKKFHSFYEACRIIGSDRDVELSRLQMALATKAVLKEAMNLLAIDTIDRL